jgi:hypothetical protein
VAATTTSAPTAPRPAVSNTIAWVCEWLANGRQLPSTSTPTLAVSEVILRYWRYAKGYYRKRGQPTSELDFIRHQRLIRRLGVTPLMYQHGEQ